MPRLFLSKLTADGDKHPNTAPLSSTLRSPTSHKPAAEERLPALFANRHLPNTSNPLRSNSPTVLPPRTSSPSTVALHSPYHHVHDGIPWSSQQSGTMWLLPPSNDHSSLALLLSAEMKAHNKTTAKLHATELRQLELVQQCDRLKVENSAWAAAYNGICNALRACTTEYKASSECATISRMHLPSNSTSNCPSNTGPPNQPKESWPNMSQPLSSNISVESGSTFDKRNCYLYVASTERDFSPSSCSSENA